MPNYQKPSVLPAWSEDSQTSADLVQPSNAEIQAGWPQTTTPPPRQTWNWVLYWLANAVRFFMQVGLVTWDAAETYRTGSTVIGDDGLTYRSTIDNNVNIVPSVSPGQWVRWGWTLAQINASQLTQTTPTTSDSSTKVATTAFVHAAVTAGAFDPTAINAHLSTLDGEVSTLQGQVGTLNTEVGTINGEITSLQSFETAQGTENTSLQSQITTNAGNIATQATHLTTIDGEITTINAEIAAIVSRGPLVTNGNGSYFKFSDGTIEAWGLSAACSTGANHGTAAITFPNTGSDAFTTTPIVTGTPDNTPSGDTTGAWVLSLSHVGVSTAGCTAYFGSGSPVGGGGGSITNTVHSMWHAFGK